MNVDGILIGAGENATHAAAAAVAPKTGWETVNVEGILVAGEGNPTIDGQSLATEKREDTKDQQIRDPDAAARDP